MSVRKWKASWALAIAAGLFGVGAAKAATVKVVDFPAWTQVGTDYQYTYSLILDSKSQFTDNAPDQLHFFTILDFPGITAVNFTPDPTLTPAQQAAFTWTAESITLIKSTNLTGFGGLNTVAVGPVGDQTYRSVLDNPSLGNARLTYDGEAITTGQLGRTLGDFTVTSSVAPGQNYVLGAALSIDHQVLTRTTNPPTYQYDDQISLTNVYVPNAIPLPAAAWSGLVLLGGLKLWSAVRRRRDVSI